MSILSEIIQTDVMAQEINRGLMVQWINADLTVRYVHDVRRSIVLYDEGRVFFAALPASMVVSFADAEDVQQACYDAGVRFWSKGIV